jgi:ubiquinone/menaquinone biosynthesis C-methylase UbiE
MTAKRRPAATKKPGATRRRRSPAAKPAARHHDRHHGEGRDAHGNPKDVEAYLARLDDPARARWQRPDRVVAALKLTKRGRAAEVGSGTGLFTIRMAKALGEDGRVYAIDVDARMLTIMAERAAKAKAWGIVGLLSPEGDGLPPEEVDVILMANVLHHVQERPRYLRALASRLAPGGRIAIVDFHDRETPVGPPVDHRLSREGALADLKAAGLKRIREETFLPYQYFLIAGR